LHVNDTIKKLEYLENWLINITQIENNEIKEKILTKTFETLFTFCKITSDYNITSITSIIANEKKFLLINLPAY